MNILITSYFFKPHIGGIETITENLANEFVRMGHKVIIITKTPLENNIEFDFPYQVLREPSPKQIIKAYKWCDIFVHSGISLKWVWPLFFKKKPWVVIYHQVYYQKGWKGYLKRICSNFSHNIAVSNTTKNGYNLKKAIVIHNSYNHSIFKNENKLGRKNFVFVGAITYDKGCHILLDAFNEFKINTYSDYKLIIIGEGKDKQKFEAYAESLSSKNDIIFVGRKEQEEVAAILNENRILIVPSTTPEAFGIVTLEGLACGCIVVGSNKDGIEEALGGCGILFEKGDVNDLCLKMKEAYYFSEQNYREMQINVKNHLEKLSIHNIAKQYISLFKDWI